MRRLSSVGVDYVMSERPEAANSQGNSHACESIVIGSSPHPRSCSHVRSTRGALSSDESTRPKSSGQSIFIFRNIRNIAKMTSNSGHGHGLGLHLGTGGGQVTPEINSRGGRLTFAVSWSRTGNPMVFRRRLSGRDGRSGSLLEGRSGWCV